MDFCDKKPDPTPPPPQPPHPTKEPSITVTANPNQVQIDQEAIIQVTFVEPACDARAVHITSPTLTSIATVELPRESACSGTVRLAAANRLDSKEYGCQTYNSGFNVDVTGSSGISIISISTNPILTIIGRKGYLDYISCYPEVYKVEKK